MRSTSSRFKCATSRRCASGAVAVLCSVVPCVATCCSVLQCVAVCCSTSCRFTCAVTRSAALQVLVQNEYAYDQQDILYVCDFAAPCFRYCCSVAQIDRYDVLCECDFAALCFRGWDIHLLYVCAHVYMLYKHLMYIYIYTHIMHYIHAHFIYVFMNIYY